MGTLPSGSTQIGFVVRGATPLFFYKLTTNTTGIYDTGIYVTDGTPNGATQIFDIPASSVTPYNVHGGYFFLATEPGPRHDALLYSDGTQANSNTLVTSPAGTLTLQDSFNNTLGAFSQTVHNPSGTSTDTLYSSDGTTAGTLALASVTYGTPGDASGGVSDLTSVGAVNVSVLDASDAQGHHEQVLVSDGTPAGSHIALSGIPGTIAFKQTIGGVVFITASTSTSFSLYAVPTDGAPGSLIFSGAVSAYNVFSIRSDGSKFIVRVTPQVGAAQTLWGRQDGTGFAPAGNELLYIGPSAVAFAAANYFDQTHGSIRAPAAADSVTFNSSANFSQLIGGNGNAAFLTLNGQNQVTGSLSVGQLTAGGTGQLTIAQGGTISAAAASINLYGFYNFVQGQFTVSGTLSTAGYLSVEQNGRVQAGTIVEGSAAGFDGPLGVDPNAAIEIGGLGTATGGSIQIDPGATLDLFANSHGAATIHNTPGIRLIDNGVIAIAPGIQNISYFFQLAPVNNYLGGGLSGTGTVILQAGVSVSTTSGYVNPGSLSFQLASNVTLELGAVSQGNTIYLNGADDVLALVHGPTALKMQATVAGFSAYDAIIIDSPLTGAVFAGGTLSLNNGTTTVEKLLLSGNYASNFQVFALDAMHSEIVLGGTVTAGPSTGTTTGHAFHWSGPVVADWNSPAGWADDTTGATSSAVAPGSLDWVSFASPGNLAQVINGNANAAQLTLGGSNIVTGSLTVGTLATSATTDRLTIQAGAGIATGSASLAGFTTVDGTLSATGTLNLNTAANAFVNVVQGGHLQAAGLDLELRDGLRMDTMSSIEIGSGHAAAAGQLVIDTGAAVLTSGGILLDGGDIIDNGSITVSNLAGFTPVTLVSAGSFDSMGHLVTPGLFGTGSVSLQAGTSVDASQGSIGAGSLAFSLAATTSLRLSQVGAGNTIALSGGHDRLTLFGTRANSSATPSYSMAATISGFDATDVIDIDTAVTSATYIAGTGTLVLANGTTQMATIALTGNYTGTSFLAVPVTTGLTQISVAPAPGGATSAGTAGQTFQWNGPVAGNWNTASNWTNLSTGTSPAPVAPGINDVVNFNTPSGLVQVVGGNGNAKSINFNNGAYVTGTLTTTVLNSFNSIDVAAGGALVTTTGTIASTAIVGSVQANGTLTVLSGGLIGLTNGGILRAGQLALQNSTQLVLDSTSSIEVGTANAAVAGAVLVDAGAMISVLASGGMLTTGKLIDRGVITVAPGVQDFFLSGLITSSAPISLGVDISGTGAVIVQDHVAVDTLGGVVQPGSLAFQLGVGALLEVSQVGAGNTVTLGGAADVLEVAAIVTSDPATQSNVFSYNMQATVAGFDASDAILFDSTVDSAAYTPGGGNTGTLSIMRGGSQIALLTLSGNYAGESFLVTPVVQNATLSSEITLFQGAVSASGGVVTVSPLANATVSLNALLAAPAYAPSGVIDTLVLNSAGTLNASGALAVNNLHVTAGGNLALNAGTLAATPIQLDAGGTISGTGTLGGPITDSGAIVSVGGLLVLSGAVSGSGRLAIGTGAILEVDGALSNTGGLAFTDATGKLLLGTGGAAITQIMAGDAIGLSGQDATSFALDSAGRHLTVNGASRQATVTLPGTFQPSNFLLANGVVTETMPCFATGAGIATPQGRVSVESLSVGDAVLTGRAGPVQVIWIGTRTIDVTLHAVPENVWPVCVEAHAFGPGRPERDLFLSPDHAIFTNGVLIPVRRLLNGITIRQQPRDRITYWHIELERHNILLAEGLRVESYLDTGNRNAFGNGQGTAQLHPDFARAPVTSFAPLHEEGPIVEDVRRRLLVRVCDLGFSQAESADLHILADGHRIDAGADGCFCIPPGTSHATLACSTGAPGELDPASNDYRRLGVALSGLDVGMRHLRFDDPLLTDGFYPPESGWRWTNGRAGIPPELWLNAIQPVRIRPCVHARASVWIAPPQRHVA